MGGEGRGEGRGGRGEGKGREGGGGRGRRKWFSAMNKPGIQYDLLNASCCYFTDTYILLALAILLEQQVTLLRPIYPFQAFSPLYLPLQLNSIGFYSTFEKLRRQ